MRPQDAAREAARRAGMTLEEWLEALAEDDGFDQPPQQHRQPAPREGDTATQVNRALDTFGRNARARDEATPRGFEGPSRKSGLRSSFRNGASPRGAQAQPQAQGRSGDGRNGDGIDHLHDQFKSLETLVDRLVTSNAQEEAQHPRRSRVADLSERMERGPGAEPRRAAPPPPQAQAYAPPPQPAYPQAAPQPYPQPAYAPQPYPQQGYGYAPPPPPPPAYGELPFGFEGDQRANLSPPPPGFREQRRGQGAPGEGDPRQASFGFSRNDSLRHESSRTDMSRYEGPDRRGGGRSDAQQFNALFNHLRNLSQEVQAIRSDVNAARGNGRNDSQALATVRADLADMIGSLRSEGHSVSPQDLRDALQGLRDELVRRPQDNGAATAIREAVADLRDDLAMVFDQFINSPANQSHERMVGALQSMGEQIANLRFEGAGGQAAAQIDAHMARLREDVQAHFDRNTQQIEQQVGALGHRIDATLLNPIDGLHLERLQSHLEDLQKALRSADFKPGFDLLAREIKGMSTRIEALAAGGKDITIGAEPIIRRLDDLSRKIEARQDGHSAFNDIAVARLEDAMADMARKVDAAQSGDGGGAQLGHLEQAITALAARLDKTGETADRLGTIERGLADLFVQIEDTRLAALEGQAGNVEGAATQLVSDLRAKMASLQSKADERDQQHQATLESVNKTLQWVVERVSPGEPKLAPPAPIPAPAPPAAPPAPAAMVRGPAPAKAPEPALAAPTPEARPQTATAAGSNDRASFIAAARKAAQAAVAPSGNAPQVAPNARPAPVADEPLELERADIHQPIGEERASKPPMVRKSILIGVGVLLMLAAALQIGVQTLKRSGTKEAAPVAAQGGLPSTPSKSFGRPAAQAPAPTTAAPAAPATPATPESAPPAASPAPSGQATPPGTQQGAAGAGSDVTGAVAPRQVMAATPGTNISSGWATVDGGSASRLPKKLVSAAEGGDASAAYEMAMRYLEGRGGLTADPAQAARWFQRAADAGLAPAQWHIGSLYEKGAGVGRNLEEATRYYKAAAAQGNAKAMYNLAVLHANASGGAKPDYKASAQWFREAAERGLVDSQYNLAILYARGLGIEQSLSESYKWFALAAQGGDADAARKRDEIGRKLSDADLTAAKQAAQAFRAQQEPERAVRVPAPAGGWDDAAAAPQGSLGQGNGGQSTVGQASVGKVRGTIR